MLTFETTYALIGLAFALGLLLASGPGIVLLQITRFCMKALLYMARNGMVAFFFGTDRDTRRYRDPLMDIIADNPILSMAFVRRTMSIASLSSVGSAVPCAIYLSKHWEACEKCDRPLRWWLLVSCVMSLLQLPLRIVFSLRLRYLAEQRIDLMTAGVHYLTSSRAWTLSKTISLASYAWFVLGVFWFFSSTGSPDAPSLLHATIGVMALSLVRLFTTLGTFYYYFPSPPPGQLWLRRDQAVFVPASMRPAPLERKKIETLAVRKFQTIKRASSPQTGPDICSICLTDFEASDYVRDLPSCKHIFHVPCIDMWLQNCGTCPLCQRAVG